MKTEKPLFRAGSFARKVADLIERLNDGDRIYVKMSVLRGSTLAQFRTALNFVGSKLGRKFATRYDQRKDEIIVDRID